MRNNYPSTCKKLLFITLILIVQTFSLTAQRSTAVEYLSPLPGSQGNDVNTNIIIGFKALPRNAASLPEIFHLTSGHQILSFTVSVDQKSNKVLLEPTFPLPVNSLIEVHQLSSIVLVNNEIVNGIEFSFFTNSGFKQVFYDNEGIVNRAQAKPPKEVLGIKNAKRSIQNDISKQIPILVNASNQEPNTYYTISSICYSPTYQNRINMINTNGEILFERPTPGYALDFKMQTDSTFSYFSWADSGYIILDSRLQPTDTIRAGNGYATDNHELKLDKKTGHYFILAQQHVTMDLSKVVLGGQPDADILASVIQEIDPVSNKVLFEWKTIDHLPVTDAIGVDLTSTQPIDYVHSNAIDLDSDTTFLLSSRHLNEVTFINRKTGDIIWRLGSSAKIGGFAFVNDPDGFSYQHDAQRLPNGNILLFDNGNTKKSSVRYSRAAEYQLDENNKVADLVWEYRHIPDVISDFMGSVQRLPNGNTVIGWGGGNPTLTEVDSSNNIVFEGGYPSFAFSYRSFKYHIPALMAKNQPSIVIADTLNYCNANESAVKAQVKSFMRPFVPSFIGDSLYSVALNGNDVYMIAEDTTTNFYAFKSTTLDFDYARITQNDTQVCTSSLPLILTVTDGCKNLQYKWSTGSNASSISVSPTENSTLYFLDMNNGTAKSRDSVRVILSSVPDFEILGQPSLNQPYQVLTYSVPLSSDFKYNWKVINGNLLSDINANHVSVQWGNKPVSFLQATITNSIGCSNSVWDTIYYSKTVSGLEQLQEMNGMKVYPNPFQNNFSLEGTSPYTFQLLDLAGNLITKSSGWVQGAETINTDGLAAGYYLLDVTSGDQQARVKLFKQ